MYAGLLISQDAALEKENAQSEQIEKMIRFQRDLFPLLNNFVNFSDFYSRRGAIFQAGTLYLDGRSCNLCVRVNDPGVNGRVKINVPFGGALTSIAVLPRGSERSLRDPYAEKKRRWPIYVALLAALLALAGTWYFGKLDAHLPERIRSTTVLGGHAPAEEVTAPKKVTPPAQPGALPAGAEEK